MGKMIRSRGTFLVVSAIALSIFASSAAEAQRRGPPGANGRNKIQSVRFDVHGSVGWWWALGVGFRVEFPIVPDGFIDSLDDELALSFGGDIQFLSWDNRRNCNGYGCWGDWSFWPQAAAQWNFYLTPKWSVFAEAGVAVGVHECGSNDVCGSASPLIGVGGRWHFAPPRVALFVRVNHPFGAQIGLNF